MWFSPLGRGVVRAHPRRAPHEQRKKGTELLKKAAFLQFSLPGIPCIFYGDELAMEGYGDPYCRGT